jgi:hypothetical protein
MTLVPEVVGRAIARNALLAQKNSPQVLFGVGVVGMVGSTVLACRATLKMDNILSEAKGKLEVARTLEHEDYSEDDRGRDVALIQFQTGVKIAKAYVPAVAIGVLSVYALTRSHNILTQRNIALTAAYAALEKGFGEYRGRVIEKYGADQDAEFRHGSVETEIVDPETGRKKKVKRVNPGEPSIYARFFDDHSTSWNREPEYNKIFLLCQQNYANDLLQSRGHVFLNEVYDMLGIPRSKAGAVVGWLLSAEGETDNFVNFGVFDGSQEVIRDFVNGLEGAILLDFNVDGVIYDKI